MWLRFDEKCISLLLKYYPEALMPSLQVRDLPEHIYQKLQQNAEAEHRSLAQQAVITLAKGLKISTDPKTKRRKALQSMEELSNQLSQYSLSDPVKRIREDRER